MTPYLGNEANAPDNKTAFSINLPEGNDRPNASLFNSVFQPLIDRVAKLWLRAGRTNLPNDWTGGENSFTRPAGTPEAPTYAVRVYGRGTVEDLEVTGLLQMYGLPFYLGEGGPFRERAYSYLHHYGMANFNGADPANDYTRIEGPNITSTGTAALNSVTCNTLSAGSRLVVGSGVGGAAGFAAADWSSTADLANGEPLHYGVDPMGWVTIQGTVNSVGTASSTLVFTLPGGMRPQGQIYVFAHQTGGTAAGEWLRVRNNGEVHAPSTTGVWQACGRFRKSP